MSRFTSDDKGKIAKLENELKSLQETFRQLTEEEKRESYDIRRSRMLKAQIIQLERQCALLSDALSSRASVMIETENELISITEKLQQLLADDAPGPNVSVSRKELISLIHTLQKLKGSIRKQSILCEPEKLRIPQLSGVRFCKGKPVSCFDVCSGKIDHINLQHVAYLESNLVVLLKRLTSFQTLLQSTVSPTRLSSSKKGEQDTVGSNQMPESFLLSLPFRRLVNDASSCVEQLEICCQDLLTLSLLHPSAPWTVAKNSDKFRLFEPKDIYSGLSPSLLRHKEIKSVVTSLCKAHNYLMHTNQMKLDAIRQEVDYSRRISSTYLHYMNCLLEGVMKAYDKCELSLSKSVSEPVGEIFDSWMVLKSNQTDATMRQFMTIFKKNEASLAQLLETVSCTSSVSINNSHGLSSSESGLKALRSFGVELKENIESLKCQCVKDLSRFEDKIQKHSDENEDEVLQRMKKALFGQPSILATK